MSTWGSIPRPSASSYWGGALHKTIQDIGGIAKVELVVLGYPCRGLDGFALLTFFLP